MRASTGSGTGSYAPRTAPVVQVSSDRKERSPDRWTQTCVDCTTTYLRSNPPTSFETLTCAPNSYLGSNLLLAFTYLHSLSQVHKPACEQRDDHEERYRVATIDVCAQEAE